MENTRDAILVGGDPTERRILKRWLENAGLRVTTVMDSYAAIEHFDSWHYDLVVTHQDGVGLSGVEFAVRVRRRWPDTKILLVGGYEERGFLLGANPPIDELLLKPLRRPIELYRLLGQLFPPVGRILMGPA